MAAGCPPAGRCERTDRRIQVQTPQHWETGDLERDVEVGAHAKIVKQVPHVLQCLTPRHRGGRQATWIKSAVLPPQFGDNRPRREVTPTVDAAIDDAPPRDKRSLFDKPATRVSVQDDGRVSSSSSRQLITGKLVYGQWRALLNTSAKAWARSIRCPTTSGVKRGSPQAT